LKNVKSIELHKDINLNEAFKAGTSAKVAEKVFSILSRKIGENIFFAPIPTEFSTKNDKYFGYYAILGTSLLLRINFRLGKSDTISSFDIFKKNSRRPEYTIDLLGFNIVQVMGMIADVITGEFFTYAESKKSKSNLKERVTNVDQAIEFLTMVKRRSEREFNSIANMRGGDAERFLTPYYEEAYQFLLPRKPFRHIRSFTFWIGKALESMGVDNNVPSIDVQRGLQETPINTDTEAESTFNEVYENEHILKFTIFEHYCMQIANNNEDFVGIYVYGSGGVGKSHTIKKYIEPLSNSVILSGKVKGYLGFANLLYKHKDDKILVLDDVVTKEDMKNSAIENILKAVLDPEQPRQVTIVSHNESSASFDGNELIINLNEEEYKEYMVNQKLNEEEDVIDLTTGGDSGISRAQSRTNFEFKSTIIFLTNYNGVPQALQDRCWTLEMVFTNEQILDLIDRALIGSNPDAPEYDVKELFKNLNGNMAENADKVAVKEFLLNQNNAGVLRRTLSFRVFKRLLSLYMATKHTPMWKHFLQIELNQG
jgi:hypothetical protein